MSLKHGLDGKPEGRTWARMKERCYSPSCKDYKYYGGNGVKVCEFIKESPLNLVNLIGPKVNGMTVDRIDSSGHYSCGGCSECAKNKWPMNIRWATRLTQVRNRSCTITVTFKGEVKYLKDLADENGLDYNVVFTRYSRGSSGDKLIAPKRISKTYDISGQKRTLVEWSQLSGLRKSTIKTRISLGITGERLLSPPKPIGRHYSK